jgi:hypothetical protein
MSKLEKIIIAICFLVLLASFQHGSKINFFISQLDSALMVENIDSAYEDKVLRSQIGASALKAIATVIVQKAGEVCSQPLREDHVESIDMFDRHAYGILYVLAPLRAISSGPAITSTLHALAFIGLLFAIYLFLRKDGLSIPSALLFSVFVAVHPAWSASVFGQFYPDRFFIFTGFLYIVLLHRRLTGKVDNTWTLIITAIVASSLTERAAIMIGVSTLATLILYRDYRKWVRKDIFLLGLSSLILAYALIYMKLVQQNSDYGSFSSQALSFFSNINTNEVFKLNLVKYLWINLPYLILAVFEWRLALIAFGAMLPNMIGSIGGAEKTGWSTHYHSMYFPFLIAAASLGFLRLCRLVDRHYKKLVLYLAMLVVVLYMAMLNPDNISPFWDYKYANIRNHAIMKIYEIEANFGNGVSIRKLSNNNRAVADAIPENISVSTFEGMMPSLLGKGRTLHYYPLGIGSVDYIILSFVNNNNDEPKYFGAFSYLDADNKEALDSCLNQRIFKEYKLERTVSPKDVTSSGVAIFKRLKEE